MIRRASAVLAVAALAVLAGGCDAGYYDGDGYYHHRDSYYRDRDARDRDYDRDRSTANRVRVCDSDGDDCHWEYRQR